MRRCFWPSSSEIQEGKVAFFPPLSMILLIILIHFFVAYEQTLIFSTDLFIAGKDTEGWIILDCNISAYGSTYLIFHGEKWSLIFYSNKKMWTNAFSAYKSDLFLPAVSALSHCFIKTSVTRKERSYFICLLLKSLKWFQIKYNNCECHIFNFKWCIY